jgi:hypothetical protein
MATKQSKLDQLGVNAQATQIRTTIAEKLKPQLLRSELNDGLEYGAGLCHGAEYLGLESYEPAPKEGVNPTYTKVSQIKKKYKFILCTYVLNVVAEDTRLSILRDIKSLLKGGGRAIVVVRGMADFKNTKKQDHIMKKGGQLTYQHGFRVKELLQLCEQVGFHAEKLNGSTAKSVRVVLT